MIYKTWDAFSATALAYPQQMTAVDTWAGSDTSLILPSISPTEDEGTRLATIMNEVTTYTDEMFSKFIMGKTPLTEFDNYVNTVKKMKIDDALKIEQDALDRFNKR